MVQFVYEAGWGIWPVFLFGGMAFALAVIYLVRPRSRYLPLVMGSSLATLIAGFLGTLTGIQKSAGAMVEKKADTLWLFLVGLKESLGCLVAALVIVCVVTLIATVAGYRRASKIPEGEKGLIPDSVET